MKRVLILIAIVAIMCGCASTTGGVPLTSTPSFKEPLSRDRTIVIISDLHLGVGKNAAGAWYATEDFRWQRALKSFLDDISKRGNGCVDLVIDGDFLDMWQPPASVRCNGANADLGCTVEEMKAIASWIVKAHSQDFENLRDFALTEENRLYIVPGNHDSSLLIPAVWEPLGKALGSDDRRVKFVTTGIWTSSDNSIVVEHGHQIGHEVNRYDTWPDIVRKKGGKEYVFRPWGELFVQKLFNDEENVYPIIDNLSPESAGLLYRVKDRGVWGTASDMAQMVAFNVFQTSWSQKIKALGSDDSSDDKPDWNIAAARKLGYKLFIAAMPKDDAFRSELLDNSDYAKSIRTELDILANDSERLPADNVNVLCDLAYDHNESVCDNVLGAGLETTLIPRERLIAAHLRQRQKEFPKMRYFIYGHTHLLEEAWRPKGVLYVKVLNSGAFQRTIDKERYLRRVGQKSVSPADGLRKISLEELPPCYTFVFIPFVDGAPHPDVLRWVMEETADKGKEVKPKDKACQ